MDWRSTRRTATLGAINLTALQPDLLDALSSANFAAARLPLPYHPVVSTSNETADDTPPLARAPSPIPGVLLVWTAGVPTHRAFRLDTGTRPLIIGGDATSDVELGSDEALSRRHAEISVDGDELVVRDDASRNGTFFNRGRVRGAHRTPLEDGGILRAGGSVFLVEPDLLRLGEHAGLAGRPGARRTLIENGSVVGAEMVRIQEAVVDAANRNRSLLIYGPTGSGKERIARLYFDRGPRTRGEFIPRNCSHFGTLADAELFGATRGAYTGAERNRVGAFELANRGVLFLDEIAELSLEVQPKLLRVLEERVIYPLGGDPKAVDVGIVCATHADLRALVAAGRFRQDLYTRLVQRQVELPPLRERLDEIPYLVEMFRSRTDGAPPSSARFIEDCLLRPWPSNVRELEVFVECSAAAAARAGELAIEPAPEPAPTDGGAAKPVRASSPPPAAQAPVRTLRESLDEAILTAYDANGEDVSAPARSLNVSRNRVYATLRRAGRERKG